MLRSFITVRRLFTGTTVLKPKRKSNVKPPRIISNVDAGQEANLKKLFDDFDYHDSDFDYVDHRSNSSPRKRVNQKFQSLKFERTNHASRNALFDEDDFVDDSPTFEKIQNKKKVPNKQKTQETKKEKKLLTEYERKLAKMQSRKLVPLPYDITPENQFEILNRNLAPLGDLPYEKQLKLKHEHIQKILTRLGEKLQSLNSPVRLNRNGLPCPLDLVVRSPQTERYRNKDEFNVWPGIDGQRPIVGFLVGQASKHETVVCVPPDHVTLSKTAHIELATSFQHYLQTVSKLSYCENFGLSGHWRRLTVRSNEAGDLMMVVNLHPQDLSREELEREMDQVRQHFGEKVQSLYFVSSRNLRSTHSNVPEEVTHLAGQKTISETLFGRFHFELSPNSFFQVNTSGAHVLYQTVIDQLDLRPDDLVLDLCCGTGTLSILLSAHCERVLGIDSSQSSISDAKQNAERNGVTNVDFLCGKVEDLLPKLTGHFRQGQRILAILNPSRRGVPPSVTRVLRRMSNIEKLVYVSCKPEAEAFGNFGQLCVVETDHCEEFSPFVPTNAVPVDLFPQTEHCELVLTFERF